MADVASAATMTAAQLRAVGTRLLGFYLGGGGAKVDALVDTSMLGARDAAGLFQFEGIAGVPCALNVVPPASNQFGGIQVYTGGQHEMSLLAKGSTGEVNLSCGRSVGWGGHLNIIIDTVETARFKSNEFLSAVDIKTRRATGGGGTVKTVISNGTDGTSGSPAYTDLSFTGGSAEAETARIRVGNSFANTSSTSISFACRDGSGLADRLALSATYLRPVSDNSLAGGGASNRFTVFYAATGTINTCDVRFKTFRTDRQLREAEHAAALALFDAFGFYQFNDAIEAKGADGARWHFGPAAQQAYAIWADHGLCAPLVENEKGELVPPPDAVPPAFICFDLIEEERSPVTEGWRPSALLGPDGQPVMVKCAEGEEATEQRPTGEMIVTREAGHIFGVRIDQLHSIMLAALNAERKAMAARIAELAARIAADAA